MRRRRLSYTFKHVPHSSQESSPGTSVHIHFPSVRRHDPLVLRCFCKRRPKGVSLLKSAYGGSPCTKRRARIAASCSEVGSAASLPAPPAPIDNGEVRVDDVRVDVADLPFVRRVEGRAFRDLASHRCVALARPSPAPPRLDQRGHRFCFWLGGGGGALRTRTARATKKNAAFSTNMRPHKSFPYGDTNALSASLRNTSAGNAARMRVVAPDPMTPSGAFRAGSPRPAHERAALTFRNMATSSAEGRSCAIT